MPLRFVILILSLMFIVTAQSAEGPRVVVGITPVHSLVAGVTHGVTEPELLVSGSSSPHNYMLKPSQVKNLQRADVVVWVGESVEGFLPKYLSNLDVGKTIIELMAAPDMLLLPAREGGLWPAADAQHHDVAGHEHGNNDGHLWLNPTNAAVIVDTLVSRLSQLNPQHAETYHSNGERMLHQLAQLDTELEQTLAPVGQTPYLVFHDAYQYLEQRYQLNPVGAIMVDPERKPGARRLQQLRDQIKQQQIRCVFSEPQFSDKLLHVISEDSTIKTATLDPMGVDLAAGQALYFDLMRGLVNDLVACLK